MWALQPHPLPRPLERVPPHWAPAWDCWFWKTTVAKSRRAAQASGTPLNDHRYRAFSLSPLPWSLSVWLGPAGHLSQRAAGHPGTPGFTAFQHNQQSSLHVPGVCTTRRRKSPLPSSALVLMVLPWLPAADGVKLPVTRRPAGGSRLRRIQQELLRTWADVAKATGHPDRWGLDPRILYDTSAALWKAGYRFLDGYQSAIRQDMVLRRGSFPDSFFIHFRRIKRAAARQCVTFSIAGAHSLLLATKSDCAGQKTTTSLECACASVLAALCPVHVLRAQHSWARVGENHSSHPTDDGLGSVDAPTVVTLAKATSNRGSCAHPSRPWTRKRVDLRPGAKTSRDRHTQ